MVMNSNAPESESDPDLANTYPFEDSGNSEALSGDPENGEDTGEIAQGLAGFRFVLVEGAGVGNDLADAVQSSHVPSSPERGMSTLWKG